MKNELWWMNFIHDEINMNDVEWISLWMKSEQWWMNFHPSNGNYLLWMKNMFMDEIHSWRCWHMHDLCQRYHKFLVDLLSFLKSLVVTSNFLKNDSKIVAQWRESNLAIKVWACKLQSCLIIMYNEFNLC